MPSDFKSAFSNARKQGAKVFSYNGKQYTTQFREEKVFDDIIQEYPMLSTVYNNQNTVISVANKERRDLNKKLGGGGAMETWFPDNDGPPGFPHPSPGKYNFEIYDDNTYNDDEVFKTAVYLDMVHGMKKNPEWAKLRNEFNTKWKPDELQRLKKKYEEEANQGESMVQYFDRTVIDAYLRGGLNPMSDEYLQNGGYKDEYAQLYRGQIKENGKPVEVYSQAQRDIIKRMQEYLKSQRQK